MTRKELQEIGASKKQGLRKRLSKRRTGEDRHKEKNEQLCHQLYNLTVRNVNTPLNKQISKQLFLKQH